MALAHQKQFEALADRITECADSIHDRLMKAIKNKEIEQDIAQSIFQDEAILRQRADSLYIDAAYGVVDDVLEAQVRIIDVIGTAKEKIKTINEIANLVDLVADLLVLTAATYAAKSDSILAALKEVQDDIDALNNGPQ
jgi:hypothetical protein